MSTSSAVPDPPNDGFGLEDLAWQNFLDYAVPALERAMRKRFHRCSLDTIDDQITSALRVLIEKHREGYDRLAIRSEDPFWGLYQVTFCKLVDYIRKKHPDRWVALSQEPSVTD